MNIQLALTLARTGRKIFALKKELQIISHRITLPIELDVACYFRGQLVILTNVRVSSTSFVCYNFELCRVHSIAVSTGLFCRESSPECKFSDYIEK